MKTSSVIATWILVALIVGALTVSACYRFYTPAERADWMANKISKELALDGQEGHAGCRQTRVSESACRNETTA